MPTTSKNGRRSLGRTGVRWERARSRYLDLHRICEFRGNEKWPPCGQMIDLELKYPDPMSPSVNHKVPVHTLAWDDPLCYDPANLEAMHLVCNQRLGDGKQKAQEHPTSRNWRE